MKGGIAVIALVLFAVGCADVTAPSPGQLRPAQRSNDVFKETTPNTIVVTNACDGDVVTLVGERSGISAGDALRMVTAVAAQALGIDEHIGTIAPGKVADLLVVRGNPLRNIRETGGFAQRSSVRFMRPLDSFSTGWFRKRS